LVLATKSSLFGSCRDLLIFATNRLLRSLPRFLGFWQESSSSFAATIPWFLAGIVFFVSFHDSFKRKLTSLVILEIPPSRLK
jgi:hypothetical protein